MTDPSVLERVMEALRELSNKVEVLNQKLDLSLENTRGLIKGHAELLQKDMMGLAQRMDAKTLDMDRDIQQLRTDIIDLYEKQRECKVACNAHCSEADRTISDLLGERKAVKWLMGLVLSAMGVLIALLVYFQGVG